MTKALKATAGKKKRGFRMVGIEKNPIKYYVDVQITFFTQIK